MVQGQSDFFYFVRDLVKLLNELLSLGRSDITRNPLVKLYIEFTRLLVLTSQYGRNEQAT